MSRGERVAVAALAAISLVLRGIAFFHYRFDSDESQHLHVTWGWTAGLLQYRDVFDNHAPLFHIVTAPVLKAVGETENALFYMRAPMFALWAVVLIATFVLARRLYSTRIAIWSTVLLSLLPTFFLKSLEYRTDNLWNAFWFLALVALSGGALTAPRFFIAGLLLGCALATSLKTALLIVTLAGAGIASTIAFKRRVPLTPFVAVAAGFVIVPAIVVAYFASRGALPNLLYCVFDFNELLARMRSPARLWIPRAFGVVCVVLVQRIAWRRLPVEERRFFFAFATALFFVLLMSFWILISPRDFLPFLPFLAIFFVAWVERRAPQPLLVYILIALLSIAEIARDADHFANRTREYTTALHQALRLSRPGEPVIDYKGETIYRRRPYYYVLEFISRNALIAGLLKDTIPEDIVRTKCYVAQADGEFWPERGRAFMSANFLDMGRYRAAGKWIHVHRSFTIAVPGPYVLIAKNGEVPGVLDGLRYNGARYLAPGEHTFVADRAQQPIACLWAPAFERGYTPFRLQDRDF